MADDEPAHESDPRRANQEAPTPVRDRQARCECAYRGCPHERPAPQQPAWKEEAV